MSALSPAQRSALALACEGTLVRWAGGYWSLNGEPSKPECIGHDYVQVPERYCTANTLWGLERRGLLEQVKTDAPGWQRPFRITEAGVEAAEVLT